MRIPLKPGHRSGPNPNGNRDWSALLVCLCSGAAERAVPVLRWTYSQLDHDHKVRSFGVSDAPALRGTEKVFRLEVVPDGFVWVGNRMVSPNPEGWAMVSTLTAYLWQPISVAIVGALAWPFRRRTEMAYRIVFLAILCCGLALLDVPFFLWALVWRSYTDAYAPDAFSALLAWATPPTWTVLMATASRWRYATPTAWP